MAHPAPGCREDADRHHRTHRHAGQELPRPALREVRLEIPRLEHSGDTRLEHSTPGWSYPVWNNPHQSALLSDLSNCHKPPRVNPVVGDPQDCNSTLRLGPSGLASKIWGDEQCPPQEDLDELFSDRGTVKASKVVNFDTDWSY